MRSSIRRGAGFLLLEPRFATSVVALLGIPISLATAVFGLVYGLLLRPLPYPEAERIVRIGVLSPERERLGPLDNRSLEMLRAGARSFSGIATYSVQPVTWSVPAGVTHGQGLAASAELFQVLGASLHAGRFFSEAEARTKARVAVLTHDSWTRRFGASPDVVGGLLRINGSVYTVVGVLARDFGFPHRRVEVWLPMAVTFLEGQTRRPDQIQMVVRVDVVGRLAATATMAQAAAEVDAILGPERGDGGGGAGARMASVRIAGMQEEMVRAARPAVVMLAGATGVLLLVACVNFSGLLLARGVSRQRTLAICAALGATRRRVAGWLLSASLLLSIAGGAAGVLLAAVLLGRAPALLPMGLPRVDEIQMSWEFVAIAVALALGAGSVFGVLPAVRLSRVNLLRVVNEGSSQSTGGVGKLPANRTRSVLVVVQMALATTLLMSGGVLVDGFVRTVAVDPGYDPTDVLTARVVVPERRMDFDGLRTAEQEGERRRFARALFWGIVGRVARMEGLAGVEAVGVSASIPLGGGAPMTLPVSIVGEGAEDGGQQRRANVELITPAWFDVMRMRVLAGRPLADQDAYGAPRVVVINQTLARRLLGGRPAVGRRLAFFPGDESREIVGVVADVQYDSSAEGVREPVVYAPAHQGGLAVPEEPFVAIRSRVAGTATIAFLRELVSDAHPSATLQDTMTMEARQAAATAGPRFYAASVGTLAVVAALLAALGLYSVLSHVVAERRKEFGIRVALGARPEDVGWLVLRQGAVLSGAGALFGALGGVVAARILESGLLGVAPLGVGTVCGALGIVGVAAGLACYVPARRATRVAPADLLRLG